MDFLAANRDRITVVDIVRDGKAIWVGDFTDGAIQRISAIKELFDLKDDILEECEKILNKNKPTDCQKA